MNKAEKIIENFVKEGMKENLEKLLKSLDEAEKMHPRNFILTLQVYLAKFQEKYGITTTEFIKNPSIIMDKTDRAFWKFCYTHYTLYNNERISISCENCQHEHEENYSCYVCYKYSNFLKKQ